MVRARIHGPHRRAWLYHEQIDLRAGRPFQPSASEQRLSVTASRFLQLATPIKTRAGKFKFSSDLPAIFLWDSLPHISSGQNIRDDFCFCRCCRLDRWRQLPVRANQHVDFVPPRFCRWPRRRAARSHALAYAGASQGLFVRLSSRSLSKFFRNLPLTCAFRFSRPHQVSGADHAVGRANHSVGHRQ